MKPCVGTDVHLRAEDNCQAAKVMAEAPGGMRVDLVVWADCATRFELSVEHDQEQWQRADTWHYRPATGEGCLAPKDE